MKRISITAVQRNIGALSIDLIRGEAIILTRNGKDFAKLVPVEPALPKPKRKYLVNKVKEPDFTPEPGEPLPPFVASINVKCEAPGTNCPFPGEIYAIEFQSDEGIEEKKVYLCPGHAQKARATAITLIKLD